MREKCTLAALAVGESGRVAGISAEEGMRRRFLDMGMISGTRVTCIGKSPFGSPRAYLVRGKIIAVRNRDAELVSIKEGSAEA